MQRIRKIKEMNFSDPYKIRTRGARVGISHTFEGCDSPSTHYFSYTPHNYLVLSVENGVSNFHDDFFLDPRFTWKCVIDFQKCEDFPGMFPKLVSCVMMWWPENILCRISVLFKIWDLLYGRSVAHLGEGSSYTWKRYRCCWMECYVSGQVGDALFEYSKTFLIFCVLVLPLLRERCQNLHFWWRICLFPLCIVPLFMGRRVLEQTHDEGWFAFLMNWPPLPF